MLTLPGKYGRNPDKDLSFTVNYISPLNVRSSVGGNTET